MASCNYGCFNDIVTAGTVGTNATVNVTQCRNGQFDCSPAAGYPQCISNLWVCDGDRDCRNGADEAICPNGMYYESMHSVCMCVR